MNAEMVIGLAPSWRVNLLKFRLVGVLSGF